MFSRVKFFSEYIGLLKYVSFYLLILLFFLEKKYTFKSLILFIIGILFSSLSVYYSGDYTPLKIFLLLFASKSILFKDIIKFDFKSRLILFVIVISLSFLGLTNDNNIIKNGSLFYSFGFAHPNICAFMLTILNLEFFYLNDCHFNIKTIFSFLFSFFFILYNIYSRTNLILLISFYIVWFLFKIIKAYRLFNFKPVKIIFENLFLILTIITILISIQYSKNVDYVIALDNILSGRIKFVNEFLSNYKINLFGNRLIFVSSEMYYLYGIAPHILDNCFINILLRFGLCVYFLYYFILKKIVKMSLDNKEYFILISLIILILIGFSETYLLNIEYNVFLLYFNNYIFKKDNSFKNLTK